MADLEQNLYILCKSNDLLECEKGLRFFVRINDEIFPAFVIRYQGKPRAYLNRCAHMQVELDFLKGFFFNRSADRLICATHGAMYDPVRGDCLSGRCDGVGLKSLPVSEINQNVCFMADTGIEFISMDLEPELGN